MGDDKDGLEWDRDKGIWEVRRWKDKKSLKKWEEKGISEASMSDRIDKLNKLWNFYRNRNWNDIIIH